MKRLILVCVLPVGMLMLAGCASGPPCLSCVYIGGDVGQSEINLSTETSTSFSGTVDKNSTMYALGAGLQLNYNLGLELSYVDFGEASWNGTWEGSPSTGTIAADGWAPRVVGAYPINDNYGIDVFGEVGVLLWSADENEIFDGSPEPGLSESGNDVLWGIGVRGKIGESLGWRFQMNRYDVWDDEVNTISGGLLYRFK
jgi:hypothetical protein